MSSSSTVPSPLVSTYWAVANGSQTRSSLMRVRTPGPVSYTHLRLLAASGALLSELPFLFDLAKHGGDVRRREDLGKEPGERRIGLEFAGLVESPDLARIVRVEQLGRGLAKRCLLYTSRCV